MLVAGKQDAFFPPPGASAQQLLGYVPTGPNVELEELENTGHAVTLGRTHAAFGVVMDRWLSKHGF
jgi:pimeloyl-ACP methyl ester carboxylesterase